MNGLKSPQGASFAVGAIPGSQTIVRNQSRAHKETEMIKLAVMTLSGSLLASAPAFAHEAHGTAILTRTEDGWRLRHLHTS